MPWVSNKTDANITVSITKKTGGGSDATFTVKPCIPYAPAGAIRESAVENYWTRKGAETLKAVIGGKEVTFEVQGDDHVNFYVDTYEIFTSKIKIF
jgi:hypothetical protein